MAKKKSNPKSPFLGRWRIVSMSTWDEDYINEEVPAFIEFDDRDGGSFQFGYYPGSKEGHIPTRSASEGSGAFPSLARRVNMQQHAELPCRGNMSRDRSTPERPVGK